MKTFNSFKPKQVGKRPALDKKIDRIPDLEEPWLETKHIRITRKKKIVNRCLYGKNKQDYFANKEGVKTKKATKTLKKVAANEPSTNQFKPAKKWVQPVRGTAGSSKTPDQPIMSAQAIQKCIRWNRPYKGSNKPSSAYENLVGKSRKQIHSDLRKQYKKTRIYELKQQYAIRKAGTSHPKITFIWDGWK